MPQFPKLIHTEFYCGHRIFEGTKIRDSFGSKIPQHRLLTRKEWAWIQKHRYSYWTTFGPIYRENMILEAHADLFWVDPQTSRAIKHPNPEAK